MEHKYLKMGDIIDISSSISNVDPITGFHNNYKYGIVIGADNNHIKYLVIKDELSENDERNRYYKIKDYSYHFSGLGEFGGYIDLKDEYETQEFLTLMGEFVEAHELFNIISLKVEYNKEKKVRKLI